jgi:hypothetical protein
MNQQTHIALQGAAMIALGLFGAVCAADPTFGPGVSQGVVSAPGIVEASGLVASRDNPGVLWTENDHGNTNQIFAIDTTGRLLGTYTLPGAVNTDWEDIAIGPGPVAGVSYIYVGMGSQNPGNPNPVYRIPEPVVYTGRQAASPVTQNLNGVQSKAFSTPMDDGEAMFVDPTSGDILLGSKESGSTKFYRATQTQFGSAAAQTADYIGSVPLSKGNGADISPDGSQILVRNQNQFALLYQRSPGQTIAQALANPNPTFITINGKDVEPNAESIAFDANGRDFYTLSEGTNQKLYRYSRTSDDAPPAPVTLVTPASQWRYLSGGATPGADWQDAGFNDASWSSGAGQFGYGNGDEQTTISYGGNANQKAAAAFFRTTFTADSDAMSALTLKILFDDGVAVYLNGTEVVRENLATDAGPGDFALSPIDSAVQNSWHTFDIDPSLLLSGINTLAVEVHGFSLTDNDLRFDFQMQGMATVPEPTGLAMLTVAGMGLLSRRRGRPKKEIR